MSTYQPDIIIYHSPCSDGFAAAWACWKKWGDSPKYFPTNYGRSPPDVSDKHVLIVDFSYKQDVIAQMAQQASTIVILDHHKSARDDLAPFSVGTLNRGHLHHSDISGILRDFASDNHPPVLASFDMDRSGARMAWDFCHETDAPKLIKLVEDRDLWRFQYEDTKPFALMLKTVAERFDTWDALNQNMTDERMIEAHGMVRYHDYLVSRIARKAHWVERGGIRFLAVNCPPELSSEVANQILLNDPDTPFAATWIDGETHRGWSLRSTDKRMDVSDIASGYGGGGHRNAAGFAEPLS